MKAILVVGLGKTGNSIIRFLKNKRIVAFDDQSSPIKVDWDDIDVVVQSPGISSSHKIIKEAKSKSISVITDFDLFFEQSLKATSVGITGTNGKSTTTALVHHGLTQANKQSSIGGNFGIPLLDLPTDSNFYVIECSSYQLELSRPMPFFVVGWTNFSPDHLERHKTSLRYQLAKERIFQNASHAVISIDDEVSLDISKNLYMPLLSVSLKDKNANIFIDEGILFDNQKRVSSINTFKRIKGYHNHQNMGIAFGVLKILGLESDEILEGFQTFPGLSHRQEYVATKNGVDFINDSKATNVDSTKQALLAFSNIFWIAGGRRKNDDLKILIPYMSSVRRSYFFGESRFEFYETFKDNSIVVETLEEAVLLAYHDAKKAGGVVFLSPACSSFDQFKSFEHRGKVFKELILHL